MNHEISKNVIEYFKELSQISRPSKEEKKASDYIVSFAKEHGFVYQQDEAWNVIVKKEATGEYKNRNTDPVLLQAHLDMVCVPNEYDWSQGVQTIIMEGNIMKGRDSLTQKDTSLGADDGIGVAIIMGILDSDAISHPPIIAIFTTDEEAGMGGARFITKETIQEVAGNVDLSKARLINIDEEQDGSFSIGCAGGVRANLKLPLEREPSPKNLIYYNVSITGLTGGHSGFEINKGRANAHRLMGRLLDDLMKEGISLSLFHIYGGEFDNAIPIYSHIEIGIFKEQVPFFLKRLEEMENTFYQEYNHGIQIEKELKIEVMKRNEMNTTERYTDALLHKIVTILMLVPSGVLAMDSNEPSLVETSSNLGVIKVEEHAIWFTCAIRSSLATRKKMVLDQMRLLMDSVSGELIAKNEYPGWAYREKSPLRELFLKTYQELYSEPKPIATAIHAGLECGYFAEKLGDIDIIACGPTMKNVHTINEVLYLDTIPKIVNLLVTVLSRL